MAMISERSAPPYDYHTALPVVRVLCVAYTIVLTVLLLAPGSQIAVSSPPNWFGHLFLMVRPVAHFVAFFGFAALMLLARWPVPQAFVVGFVVAYAGGTELLQLFIAERVMDALDLIQNLLGLGLALVCWITITTIRHLGNSH